MIGNRWIAFAGAVLAGIAVIVGSYAAHGLGQQLEKEGFDDVVVAKKIDNCKTAAQYQMYTALGLLVLGTSVSSSKSRGVRIAAGLLFLGVSLFSGGLYCIVFLNNSFHWSIVPIGGSIMIVGWIVLAITILLAGKSATSAGSQYADVG